MTRRKHSLWRRLRWRTGSWRIRREDGSERRKGAEKGNDAHRICPKISHIKVGRDSVAIENMADRVPTEEALRTEC